MKNKHLLLCAAALITALSGLSYGENKYPYTHYDRVTLVKKIYFRNDKVQENYGCWVSDAEWPEILKKIDLRKNGRLSVKTESDKTHVFDIETIPRNEIAGLVTILDDPKNYPGGECGTTSTDWLVLFIKDETDIAGLISISFDCMDVYFDPPSRIRLPYLSEAGRTAVGREIEKFGSKEYYRDIYKHKP